MSPRSVPFTVDEEDEDVTDSRTDARPRTSLSGLFRFIRSPVTGGRLLVGLDCLGLRGDLLGRDMLGEYDDIEVGVEVRLKEPGDSERRVEEPLLCAKLGVGGG